MFNRIGAFRSTVKVGYHSHVTKVRKKAKKYFFRECAQNNTSAKSALCVIFYLFSLIINWILEWKPIRVTWGFLATISSHYNIIMSSFFGFIKINTTDLTFFFLTIRGLCLPSACSASTEHCAGVCVRRTSLVWIMKPSSAACEQFKPSLP